MHRTTIHLDAELEAQLRAESRRTGQSMAALIRGALGVRLGRAARHALYEDIVSGVYEVVDVAPDRWVRVRELNTQFAYLDLGLVDAAVAALSEQLAVHRLATTDRRHFPAVQREVVLELLP